MSVFFTRIYDFFEKRRLSLIILFSSLLLLMGWFSSQLKFEEDIAKILPSDKKIEKLNEVFQSSKFIDKLVVMVSLKDTAATAAPDSLAAFSDLFVNEVKEKLKPFVSKINDKVDDELALELYSTISNHLPIYLDDKDYTSIDTLITPKKIKQTLEQDFRTLTSPAGIALKQMISNDPVGITFLGLKKIQQLQYDENFELYDNYAVTKDYRNLLLFITPAYPPQNTGKNALLLKGPDKIINEFSKKEFPGISVKYFGATAVSVGNALQLRKDSLFTQGITVLFIIILFSCLIQVAAARGREEGHDAEAPERGRERPARGGARHRPGRLGMRRPWFAVRHHDQQVAHRACNRSHQRQQPVQRVHAHRQLGLQPGQHQLVALPRRRRRVRCR